MAGKKRKLNRDLLVNYYGKERLKLSDKTIQQILGELEGATAQWFPLLDVCFLSDDLKQKYKQLLSNRLTVLGLEKQDKLKLKASDVSS